MHAHIHAYLREHVRFRLFDRVLGSNSRLAYIYIYTYAYIYMHIYEYTHIYICTYLHTYTCIYIYICIYVPAFMYLYIYAHTHTQTGAFFDHSIERWGLPPDMHLVVGDVRGSGSSTPSMVSAINKWRHDQPEQVFFWSIFFFPSFFRAPYNVRGTGSSTPSMVSAIIKQSQTQP